MQIKTVTVTGADDKVAPADLIELSEKYPFVEWGVLYSIMQRPGPRYPSLKWVDDLVTAGAQNLSAHFCGWHAREVMENERYDLILDLPPAFKRVQINYNFNVRAHKAKLDEMLHWLERHPEISIILQYNKSNTETLNYFARIAGPSNLHFLYDSSGGRGTEIKTIAPPFKNYTGYAGGIDTSNIAAVCAKVLAAGFDNVQTWLDLETGARTDNQFDLGKVAYILKVASQWANNSSTKLSNHE